MSSFGGNRGRENTTSASGSTATGGAGKESRTAEWSHVKGVADELCYANSNSPFVPLTRDSFVRSLKSYFGDETFLWCSVALIGFPPSQKATLFNMLRDLRCDVQEVNSLDDVEKWVNEQHHIQQLPQFQCPVPFFKVPIVIVGECANDNIRCSIDSAVTENGHNPVGRSGNVIRTTDLPVRQDQLGQRLLKIANDLVAMHPCGRIIRAVRRHSKPFVAMMGLSNEAFLNSANPSWMLGVDPATTHPAVLVSSQACMLPLLLPALVETWSLTKGCNRGQSASPDVPSPMSPIASAPQRRNSPALPQHRAPRAGSPRSPQLHQPNLLGNPPHSAHPSRFLSVLSESPLASRKFVHRGSLNIPQRDSTIPLHSSPLVYRSYRSPLASLSPSLSPSSSSSSISTASAHNTRPQPLTNRSKSDVSEYPSVRQWSSPATHPTTLPHSHDNFHFPKQMDPPLRIPGHSPRFNKPSRHSESPERPTNSTTVSTSTTSTATTHSPPTSPSNSPHQSQPRQFFSPRSHDHPHRRVLVKATDHDPISSSNKIESPTHTRPPFRRTLVVEDTLVNARLLLRMLEKVGLQVSHAIHGEQAVNMYEAAFRAGTAFDLVLMDCQMPVMDGFQATRLIRAFEARAMADGHPHVRAIICAVTAGAEDATPSHCYAVGMDLYLEKPVTRKAIENVLSLGSSHQGGMIVVRPD
eukprot:c11358_g2_i2.p1 GENE.c11358_g2_i2~~c11358_g2_i2.p1  ORF type:complete len:771 (+),score=153.85 c11358_g2_i2:229-2313(+)